MFVFANFYSVNSNQNRKFMFATLNLSIFKPLYVYKFTLVYRNIKQQIQTLSNSLQVERPNPLGFQHSKSSNTPHDSLIPIIIPYYA